METINDYKFKDFLKLTDVDQINQYLTYLEFLKPLQAISNPRYSRIRFWDKKTLKTLQIKSVRLLSFGEVISIRNYFSDGTIEGIISAIKLVTGLSENEIMNFTITTFYGIVNNIKQELIDIANMEFNELSDDSFDINLESINANQRMAKFGVLNTIDALANEDVLRWSEIEKLPYMTVFTKLMMDKEKNNIQRELNELQKKKLK